MELANELINFAVLQGLYKNQLFLYTNKGQMKNRIENSTYNSNKSIILVYLAKNVMKGK